MKNLTGKFHEVEDKDKIDTENIETCLERWNHKLGKLQESNQKLSDEIDYVEKDNKLYSNLIQNLEAEEKKIKSLMNDLRNDAIEMFSHREENSKKLKIIKEREEKENSLYQIEYKDLSRSIEYIEQKEEFIYKKMKKRSSEFLNNIDKELENCNELSYDVSTFERFENLMIKLQTITGHKNSFGIINEFRRKETEFQSLFDLVEEKNATFENIEKCNKNLRDSLTLAKTDILREKKELSAKLSTIKDKQENTRKNIDEISEKQKKLVCLNKEIEKSLNRCLGSVHNLSAAKSDSTGMKKLEDALTKLLIIEEISHEKDSNCASSIPQSPNVNSLQLTNKSSDKVSHLPTSDNLFNFDDLDVTISSDLQPLSRMELISKVLQDIMNTEKPKRSTKNKEKN